MVVVHAPELVVETTNFRGQEIMIAFWMCEECSDPASGYYVPDVLCPVFGPTVPEDLRPARRHPTEPLDVGAK